MRILEILEGTRCWKGYTKKGTKMLFGKRVPNCVKNENNFQVIDKFDEVVFESQDESSALNFLRRNYNALSQCDLHEDLRAWFGKGKKVVPAEVAGTDTTPKVNVLASVVIGKKVKENLNVCLKPERPH